MDSKSNTGRVKWSQNSNFSPLAIQQYDPRVSCMIGGKGVAPSSPSLSAPRVPCTPPRTMSERLVGTLETGVERLLSPATCSKATVSTLRALRLRLEIALTARPQPRWQDVERASERARCSGTLGAARAWETGIVTYMRMFLSPLEPSPQLLFFFCLLNASTTISVPRPQRCFPGARLPESKVHAHMRTYAHTRFAPAAAGQAGAPHNSPDSEAPS